MGVNTHKLVIMFLMMNILLSLVIGIYNESINFSVDEVEEELNQLEKYKEEYENPDSGEVTRDDSLDTETSFGIATVMGKTIWNALIGGFLDPFYTQGDEYNDSTIEKIATLFLIMIRLALIPLVIVEIYFVLKNRKSV